MLWEKKIMKKTILALLLSVLMITSLFAVSVEIGDGTTTTSYMPFYGYYGNGWAHYILPGDAITAAINIDAIEFNVSNTPSSYETTDQYIYMKLTNETTVTAAYTDPLTNGFTEVFNGTIVWDGSGWQGVNLTTEFAYDGTSNIEIIYENRRNAWGSGYPTFYTTEAASAGAYKYQDNSFPAVDGTLVGYYPNTKISWTIAGEPDAPILTSPGNNASNVAIGATLEWTIGDNTDHTVLYFADNAELTGATIVDPATSPYSPTLALNTTYYWKVVAVSSVSMEAESAVWSFTTEYGTAPVPYTENFDSATAGAQAAGWISLDDTGNSYSYAEVDDLNALSGDNSFHFYNSSATTGNLIGSTPKVENAGNRVRFMAKTTDTGSYLIVGTMTDATDGATFTRLDSLALTSTYTQFIVDLPGDRAEDHVSFKHGLGGSYRDIYIDDVNIEEVPTEAVIVFTPESIDFGGLMHQDTTATATTVTISNVGGVAAEITEASILNPNYFTLTDENTYPVTLEPQTSITVDVTPLTNLVGVHTSTLRLKQTDPGNPFVPINLDVSLEVEVLDSTGDDHNNPLILTLADEIIVNHTTSPYNQTYDFCTSQTVVYKLSLPQAKIMDISLEGTTWDTKLYVFNSFDQIDTATSSTDAWYYNDDSPGGTGGSRYVEEEKGNSRALWSNMLPSFAPAGEYYIIVTGYGSNYGDFVMTINSESLPAPAVGASNPFPADDAVDQPTTVTLTWDNVEYTETVDIYFGQAGSMVMVEADIPALEEYEVPGLLTLTDYEWKIVNRNYAGETPADSVETWSFSTIGSAPVAATYTSPADTATDVALTGNLMWDAVTGADGYNVYFSTDMTFTGVTPVDQTETSFAYSGDYDTTYYWKVIPYNIVGAATEGIETWSFTTSLSPFPEADLVFDGVRATNHGMPIEPYYGYTMTQNIYHQEEIDVADSAVSSISYLYNNNSAWSETIEVYVKHTTKDTFADTYDWDLDGFTHVYSGSMTVDTTNPIVTIDFSTPFVYNNTDNLMVMIFATETGYHSSADEFYNYPVEGNRSITVRSDGTNYYTSFPTSVPSGTLKAFTPVSGLTFEAVAADPVFTVSADTLTFTDQVMDTDSDAQTLTISNLGLGTLGINSLVLTGTNADQFTLTDNNTYPTSLEITENISVQVVYSPDNEGDHTAQLEITDDQARVVNVVYLEGNSIDTNIYASDLPWNESFEGDLFGWSTIVESTSDYANITLNTSATNVQDGSTAIQFYNSGDLTANLQLIAPNLVPDMDGYRLRFWTKGTIDSELILAKWDNDMNILTAIDTFDVPLTYEQTVVEFAGTTTGNERFAFIPVFATTYDYVYLDNVTFEETPAVPIADLSVTEIDFGTLSIGEVAADEVTITNVGAGVLNISSIDILGADATDFAYSTDEMASMALAANESLVINVEVSSMIEGSKVASLQITDDLGRRVRFNSANTRNANTVALTAEVVDPTISMPVTIDFEGSTTNPEAITLENFAIGTDVHNTVGNVMYKNIYSSTTNGYIQFQLMDNVTANSVISFDYRLTNWSAGTVGITSVDGHDYLVASVSSDMGNTFTPVDQINGTDHVDSAEFATFSIDISAYAGQSVIFRFDMEDDTVNDYWFDIDNIYFGEPLISELDVPVVTMATANGIAVEWLPVDNAVSYMVYAADTPDAPEENWTHMDTTTDMYYLHTGDDQMKFFKVMATTEAAGPAKRFGRRN